MNPDRQAANAARAHQIWEEAGHPHGQNEQHWSQAEREHDQAEARAVAVEQFNADPIEAAAAKPTRKRATKAPEPAVEAPARKARAPRRVSVSVTPTES